MSSSNSAQEDTYQKYDPDDYIYGADGEKAYWVADDGYDGSYQPAEYTNGPQ